MRTAVCEICKQVKPVDEIKYVMRGSKTLTSCSKCSGISPVKNKTIQFSTSVKSETSEKELRRCLRCNYKYRQNPNLKVVCPNCGRGDKTVKL